MKFSIGYNYDFKLFDLLEGYKDNIETIYFPLPERYIGSGRALGESKYYLNQIPEIIKRCSSLGINSQILLNATCGDRSPDIHSTSP